MANVKISELATASTPLAGTEVLPIVQSSATVKVSVANLTAGRAVAAASLTTTGTINSITLGRGAGSISSNTAIGTNVLAANTTGAANTVTGVDAMAANISGNSNSAYGRNSLKTNTTGSNNMATGVDAMTSNTTGGNNTAIGFSALLSNTTADNNTVVGYQAGYTNTTGVGNTYVGYNSGQVGTGSYNSYFGPGAGNAITTGSKNLILGGYTGNFGGLDIRTLSNYLVLSDGDGTPRAYQVAGGGWFQFNNLTVWSITSDARIKKNVTSLTSGLDIVQALRPVEFDYIKDDKHDIGFIAQEYQTVLPEQVVEGSDGMLSLNQNLVPYLVKAIQELKAEIDQLKGNV
jgi:hypothetical protein